MNKLNHVAFIMDGNGRWGKKRKKGRNFGHINGVKTVRKIVEASIKFKIPIITFYVFSTENWKRPRTEINFLFQLLIKYFNQEIKNVISNGIKINIIGKIKNLPFKLKSALKKTIKLTQKNKRITINLAINYGSKDEIITSIKKIKNMVKLAKFITFEGGEGAGKTTQISVAKEFLVSRGTDVWCTREPGGTALGESLRELLLDVKSDGEIGSDAELLMMFAARAQHLTQEILPRLNRGCWVLCDRFTDATYAYQGGGRGVAQERIAQLEQWVQGDLRPDKVFLFDLPVEVGMQRAKKRANLDRFEKEALPFFDAVRQCYLDRAHTNPTRYVKINAEQNVVEVSEALVSSLAKILDE